MEYARNVLGPAGSGPEPVLTPLSCSLVQEQRRVLILPGTGLGRIHGRGEASERFNCSQGLNEVHREAFVRSGLTLSALGQEGEVRAVELAGHPFFAATLYLPQLTSEPGRPHPLIKAFLAACLESLVRPGPQPPR